ncbi:unnamed protein product [Porites evermanni]|uniref:Uncharacterized protein n=1 Tax=Porites evermanni TaxID=104178 RepID=A0ABN8LWW1_9CNID|nr:unnamed protein product [Porites evermanni]
MLAMQYFRKFALQEFFEPFGGMLSSWIVSGSLTVDLNSMSIVEDESIEYFVVYYPFALTPKIFSPASILRSWEDENYVEDQQPLTNQKALLPRHHRMTSPLTNNKLRLC